MTFDPSEARDDHGKWTKGGSGGYDALTVNSFLNGPQLAKIGSRNTSDIAKDLNARGQEALKALGIASGQINPPAKGDDPAQTAKASNIVSSAIASEIEDEMSRKGDTHADDWYTSKVKDAMGVAEKMHPEMAGNPGAKFAFTAAMAVTSQGETVPNNTRLADGAYEVFAKTGKFPTDVVSQDPSSMNGNFAKLNTLIDQLGVKGTQAFLDKEFTVGELTKMGYRVGGEAVNTKVYGSAIMGPKIGQGFYQNLNGNFKPLTADMWFMRGWGRLTGTLTGTTDMTKPTARFVAALKAEGKPVPKTQEEMVLQARDIRLENDRYFQSHKKEDGPVRAKTELIFAADRLDQAANGVRDMPTSSGQRSYMRDVFSQAQEKLKEAGHNMTIADMQATWWYPEKRLYTRMGARDTDRINVDYATALRDLAGKKGLTI